MVTYKLSIDWKPEILQRFSKDSLALEDKIEHPSDMRAAEDTEKDKATTLSAAVWLGWVMVIDWIVRLDCSQHFLQQSSFFKIWINSVISSQIEERIEPRVGRFWWFKLQSKLIVKLEWVIVIDWNIHLDYIQYFLQQSSFFRILINLLTS